MERPIIAMSCLTYKDKALLANVGINNGTYLSVLYHTNTSEILTTTTMVMTQKLCNIRQYITSGQETEIIITLANIIAYFTRKLQQGYFHHHLLTHMALHMRRA